MRRYRWRDRRRGGHPERTYIQSYRSRFPGARDELSLAYFDKSRAAKLRSRHLTPKFRRKAITSDHDDDGALSEEDLR